MLRESLLSAGASPRSARHVGRASSELQALLEQAELPGALGGTLCSTLGVTVGSAGILRAPLIHLAANRASCADPQKEQLLARLSQRSVATLAQQRPAPQRPPGRLAALRVRAVAAAPASEEQLRLGLQFLVCFWAVMFLQIGDASYNALKGRWAWGRVASVRRVLWNVRHAAAVPRHWSQLLPTPPPALFLPLLLLCRPVWSMTIVVVLFESTAGSSVRKGLMRLAGTLAGAVVGIAIYYFVVLCNGLSRADHPQASSLRGHWCRWLGWGSGQGSSNQHGRPSHVPMAAEVYFDEHSVAPGLWRERCCCSPRARPHLHSS